MRCAQSKEGLCVGFMRQTANPDAQTLSPEGVKKLTTARGYLYIGNAARLQA
jgi:hypothetical protein